MTDTAVAVREERHPIIAQINAKMPEIAGMLPEGMRPERFRKVVVQALLRNPGLWECSPISVVTAITEAAEVGIEPTGVLGKGWLIPYRGEAKFIPGWRGFVDLCWRADRLLLTPELVRAGDAFEYRRGTGQYLHHVPVLDDPEREASDDNVTFAYVVVRFPDGREDFEVMSRAALDRIRDEALKKIRDAQKREQAIWNVHPGEMMKKTPIRRIAKRLPLSPAVQAMLARDEDVDYDTPVERVSSPQRDELRDRIAQRTAALRGESTEEPDASLAAGGAVPEEAVKESAPSSGGSSAKGDPYMRRLHAMANERGYDHAAMHEWASEEFGVDSLTDLNPRQRGEFAAMVERLPLIEKPASERAHDAGQDEAAADTPSASSDSDADVRDGAPDSATSAAVSFPPGDAPSAAPRITDPSTLATFAATVLGFEEPQPLKALTEAEWDQTFAALNLSDPDAYQSWYGAQGRELRSALMQAKQSPRARRDAATKAAKAKPDAEQIRAALTHEEE